MAPSANFTERSRHVLTLAQEEANRFNHNYIGTEHILLGLLREEGGVAFETLVRLGVDLPKVRSGIEFIIGRSDRTVLGEIRLTPRSRKVIELATDEAHQLGRSYIGTDHILIGLLREGEGIAAGVLESVGVNLASVRAEGMQVRDAPSPAKKDDPEPVGVLEQGVRDWTESDWRTVGAILTMEADRLVEVTRPHGIAGDVVQRLQSLSDSYGLTGC